MKITPGGRRPSGVLQELEARAVGQLQVDEQRVRVVLAQRHARVLQRAGRVHLEALALHGLGEAEHEGFVVIDEEGFGHGRRVTVF